MGFLNEGDTVSDALHKSLDPWLNSIPDLYDVTESYKEQGRLKAAITRKKRDISRAENIIIVEQDKPRSNEAKKAKLNATSLLEDELSELEAELAVIDAHVKTLEFMKGMLQAATYRAKMSMEYA